MKQNCKAVNWIVRVISQQWFSIVIGQKLRSKVDPQEENKEKEGPIFPLTLLLLLGRHCYLKHLNPCRAQKHHQAQGSMYEDLLKEQPSCSPATFSPHYPPNTP